MHVSDTKQETYNIIYVCVCLYVPGTAEGSEECLNREEH